MVEILNMGTSNQFNYSPQDQVADEVIFYTVSNKDIKLKTSFSFSLSKNSIDIKYNTNPLTNSYSNYLGLHHYAIRQSSSGNIETTKSLEGQMIIKYNDYTITDQNYFTGCSAFVSNKITRIFCEIYIDPADGYMTLKIYPYKNDKIVQNERVYVTIAFKNPASSINTRVYQYMDLYGSEYKQYAYNTKTVDVQNSLKDLQFYASSFVKNYIFGPKVFTDSTVLRTPFRFFLQTNIADSLSSDTEIILKLSGDASSTWDLDTGQALSCMLKEYNPGTKRAFKSISTQCDWVEASDSRLGITIKTPTLHNYIDTLIYEFIISSKQPHNTQGYGFLNTQKMFAVEVIVKYPTDNYYHYIKKRHYYYKQDQVQVNGFLQTNELADKDTEFYLQFTLVEAVSNVVAFPISYVELVFDGYQISDIENYSYGDEIDCGIEYFNVTRSGTGTAPGLAVLTDYGPKCIISEDQNNQNLLIRIEQIKNFESNSQLNLAIHSIKIPAKSNQDLSVEYPVSIYINYYTKDSMDFIKRQKYFYQVYLINWKASAPESIVHTLGSSFVETPSIDTQYQNGITYYIDIGAWPVNTHSYLADTFLTISKQNFGSKFLIDLGKSDQGGLMSIGENYLANIEFEDFERGGSNTFRYWDASNDQLLWKNTKTNTMIFSNQNSRTAGNGDFTLKIKNLNNPKTTEYHKYKSDIYTPKIQIKFYSDYQLTKQIQSIQYLQGFWPQDSSQSFNYKPSRSSVVINSINIMEQTQWVENEFIRVMMVIDISSLDSITQIKEQMEVLEIIFLQGITDIQMDSCVYIYKSENYFGVCNIIKSVQDNAEVNQYTAIKIHGLRDFNTLTTLDLYLWMQVNNGIGSDIQYRHKIYDWTGQVVGIDHYPSTGTYESVQIQTIPVNTYYNIVPQIFSEKYIKWYQEMFETDLTEDGTNSEFLQFIFEVPDNLNSDSHFLQIELPSLVTDQYLPSEADNYEKIQCYWIPINSQYTQIGFPIFSQNCFFTSSQDPYSYTVQKPIENLPAGLYLLKFHFKKSDLYATPPVFNLAAPPMSTEIRFYMQTSLNSYSDIVELQTLKPFELINVFHHTLTINQYDVLYLNFKNFQFVKNFEYILLKIEIRSENWYDVSSIFEDFGWSTDTIQFDSNNNMKSGDIYNAKIFENSVQIDRNIGFYAGQWSNNKIPIKFIVDMQSDGLTNDPYQIRIPMLKNPDTYQYPLNLIFSIELVEIDTLLPKIYSSYDFRNYAKYRTDSSISTTTFTTNTESQTNRAQSTDIAYQIDFSSLNDDGNGNFLLQTDLILIKWDASSKGVNIKNLPIMTIASTSFSVDYYQQLSLYILTPIADSTATHHTVSYTVSDTDLYIPALQIEEYGIKYATFMRGSSTIIRNSAVALLDLQAAADIQYIKFIIQRTADYYMNNNAIVLCEVFLSTPMVPESGAIEIQLPSYLVIPDKKIGYECFPGQNIQKSQNYPLECIPNSQNSYIIRGFGQIQLTNDLSSPYANYVDKVVSIKFFVQIASTATQNDISLNKINVFGSRSGSIIIDPSTSNACNTVQTCVLLSDPNFDITNQQSLSKLNQIFNYEKYAKLGEWLPLQIKFQLQGSPIYSLTHSSTDRLKIYFPQSSINGNNQIFQFSQSGTNRQRYVRYKLFSDNYWILSPNDTTNEYSYPPSSKSQYNIDSSVEYIIQFNTQFALNNNVKFPTEFGYYQFWLQSYQGGNVKEIAKSEIFLQNDPDDSLVNQFFKVEPIINNPAQYSVLKVSFTGQTIFGTSGEQIWIEFETNDLIQNIFDNDLGTSAFISDIRAGERELDCFESSTPNNRFSENSRMKCYLFDGDQSTRKPAVLKIPIASNILASDLLFFYVAPFKNAIVQDIQTHFTLKIMTSCRNDGQLCPRYKTYTYYQTHSSTNVNIIYNKASNYGEFVTSGSNFVGLKNVNHNFLIDILNSIQNDLGVGGSPYEITGDQYIVVKYQDSLFYPDQDTCSSLSLEICIIFPKLNQVLIKYLATTSLQTNSITITIPNMNNGLEHHQPNLDYQLEIWDPTLIRIFTFEIASPQFELHHIQNPVFQFIPTQTVNQEYYEYYILEDFNYITMKIKQGLITTKEVKQVWIHLPQEIQYIDTQDCNASMIYPDSTYSSPFPPRLECHIISDYDAMSQLPLPADRNHKIYLNILPDETQKIQDSDFPNFSIQIHLKIFFNKEEREAANDFIVGDFKAWSQTIQTTDDYQDDKLVAYTDTGSFSEDLNQFIQPILKSLTLNTKSFAGRKAKIDESTIQYYMIFEPKTQVASQRIDRMVFTLPSQFGSPSITSFDDCSLQSRDNFQGLSCTLQRSQNNRLMTFIPQIDSTPANIYTHQISIITLSSIDFSQLFISPKYPGTHYQMTIQCYSGNILVEQSTINLTNVQGLDLDLNFMQIDTVLDKQNKGLFEISFRIGHQNVPPGYDWETITTYSNIILQFETFNGYKNDIGTGQKNSSELGCIGVLGLEFKFQGRLKCKLKYGTGPEDLPEIIIEGYDQIKANTQVSIFITELQSVDIFQQGTISVGIKLIYKTFGSMQAFYYGPRPYTTPQTKELLNVYNDPTASVIYEGSNKVLQTGKYIFTFKLGTNILKITDYFVVKFPTDFFERYSDYSGVKCYYYQTGNSPQKCKDIFIVGVSNMIYLQPAAQLIGGVQVNFEIRYMISPAYITSGQKIILGQVLKDRQKTSQYTFTITRDVKSCTEFKFSQAKVDNFLGNQNNVQYTFNFITGHFVPEYGAISIYFPNDYPNSLYDLNITCQLLYFEESSYCRVGNTNRIDIYMNGTSINPQKQYSLNIKGLNNPQDKRSDFKIQSYYDENIYLDKQICNYFYNFPLIQPMPIRFCDINIQSQFSDLQISSQYNFLLQCPESIRSDTQMIIYFNLNYQNNDFSTILCKSKNPDIFKDKLCSLQLDSTSKYVILKLNLNEIKNQIKFEISFVIKNPSIAGKYTYHAEFYKNGMIYQKAINNKGVQQVINFIDNREMQIMDSNNKLYLHNVPKNTGQKAFYIFSIPPIENFENFYNQIEIYFTSNFNEAIGNQLQCGIYQNDFEDFQFANYKDLMFIIEGYRTNYNSIQCNLPSSRLLQLTSLPNKLNIANKWTHLIISNVINPPEIYNELFKIIFKQNDKIILYFEQNIVYFLANTQEYIGIQNIQVESNEIQISTNYEIQIKKDKNFINLQGINLVISINLPDSLYTPVQNLQLSQQIKCSIKVSSTNWAGKCTIFKNQILFYDFRITLGLDVTQITLQIEDLYNPTQINDCYKQEEYYEINILDYISNEIIMSTVADLNQVNCIEFDKSFYKVAIEGPSVLLPGIRYKFDVILEEPANGLIIYPVFKQNNQVQFSPQVLEFINFSKKVQSFYVKIGYELTEGNYILEFTKIEKTQIQFYSPIDPYEIQVISVKNTLKQPPTIQIKQFETQTIGYPIILPLNISELPANLMYLNAEKINDYENIMTIQPKRLLIDTTNENLFFKISFYTNFIPENIQIKFYLTSLFPIVHQIVPQNMYINFENNEFPSFDPPELYIHFTSQKSTVSQTYIGQQVSNLKNTNEDQQKQNQPQIIQVVVENVQSTSAIINIFISQKSYLYYIVVIDGNPSPDETNILEQNFENNTQKGFIESQIYQPNGQLKLAQHKFILSLDSLEAQNNYIVYFIATSPMGDTLMEFQKFRTLKPSFGCSLRIPLLEMVSENLVIQAISQTLRIEEKNIINQTSQASWQQLIQNYDTQTMDLPNMYHNIIIKPLQKHKQEPLYYCQLINTDRYKNILKKRLPGFNIRKDILFFSLKKETSLIKIQPYIKQLNYYDVTLSFQPWESSKIYAVLIEYTGQNQLIYSSQIYKGQNQYNLEVGQYQKLQTISSNNQIVDLYFEDLKDNTKYQIFITLASLLPYDDPPYLSDDDQVITQIFTTPQNPNLNLNEIQLLKKMEHLNPNLVKVLEKIVVNQN